MNKNNPAIIHAEFLKELNHGFELSKIMFQDKGLIFETNELSYWLIKRDENHVRISSGITTFKVQTRKNEEEKEFELLVFPEKFVDKFRSHYLIYIIADCFDFNNHKSESDLSKVEKEEYFDLSIRYLNATGHNAYELMEDIDPHQISSIVGADLLYELLKSSLLKFKTNKEALNDIINLMKEYELLNKSDHFDRNKFDLILDGAKKIADKYRIY